MKYPMLLILLLAQPAIAAEMPGFDIWTAAVSNQGESLELSAVTRRTNRAGYDNQPYFISNDVFLYTSGEADGQTDAWRFDLRDGTTTRILKTAESEYSPQQTPSGEIAVVRVDLEGVQQLWTLAPGAQRYEMLFPQLEGIGYQAWLDRDRVALFVIRERMELHVANRSSGEVMVLSRALGRCLQALPDSSLLFVEPDDAGKLWIKHLILGEKVLQQVAPVLEQSEDFVQLPDGTLLMARDRAVFAWSGKAWQELARFAELPGAISRLAVSPDGKTLAMVVAEAG